jgi:hypothetical protein
VSWSVTLAKELKLRENPAKIGAVLGTVINANTLQISILDGKVILDKTHLYICNGLLRTGIKNGDNILLIPTESEQIYFAIDTVTKAGG